MNFKIETLMDEVAVLVYCIFSHVSLIWVSSFGGVYLTLLYPRAIGEPNLQTISQILIHTNAEPDILMFNGAYGIIAQYCNLNFVKLEGKYLFFLKSSYFSKSTK